MEIFVVDDDPMARTLVGKFVARAGHVVVGEAGDGAEAVNAILRVRADVIVTDCQMPNLDGIAMTRKLRAAGNRARIIMLSGQSDRAVVDAAIAAGVDVYLVKPMDVGRLLAAIGDSCAGAKSAA